MKKLVSSLFIAGALLAPAVLHADPLFGTFGFDLSGVTVTPGGTDLTSPALQSINYTGMAFNNSSSTEFPFPTTGTITGSMSLYPTSANGGGGVSPYELTFGTYGTFVESGTPVLFSEGSSMTQAAISYQLSGIFTPGSYFSSTTTGGESSILFQVNESKAGGGQSYSGSGTFTITAPTASPVPEPSSLMLLGTGLLGAVGTIRRRFKA